MIKKKIRRKVKTKSKMTWNHLMIVYTHIASSSFHLSSSQLMSDIIINSFTQKHFQMIKLNNSTAKRTFSFYAVSHILHSRIFKYNQIFPSTRNQNTTSIHPISLSFLTTRVITKKPNPKPKVGRLAILSTSPAA